MFKRELTFVNLTDITNEYGKQQKKASFISICWLKRMQPLSFLLYDDFTNQQKYV